MKNTWKISDNIHLMLPELNQHQLSMLRRMIGECLPEKWEFIDTKDSSPVFWQADGHNKVIDKMVDNLKAKGLLNE